jgi:hypothetical protein
MVCLLRRMNLEIYIKSGSLSYDISSKSHFCQDMLSIFRCSLKEVCISVVWLYYNFGIVSCRIKGKNEICSAPGCSSSSRHRFSLVFFETSTNALLRAKLITLPCLLLFRSVVCGTQWVLTVHSVLRPSQWGLTSYLPFPSSFPYKPKFRQTDSIITRTSGFNSPWRGFSYWSS